MKVIMYESFIQKKWKEKITYFRRKVWTFSSHSYNGIAIICRSNLQTRNLGLIYLFDLLRFAVLCLWKSRPCLPSCYWKFAFQVLLSFFIAKLLCKFVLVSVCWSIMYLKVNKSWMDVFENEGGYHVTRVRGITHSISARRWEGDGFDAPTKPCHSQRR